MKFEKLDGDWLKKLAECDTELLLDKIAMWLGKESWEARLRQKKINEQRR